MPTDRPPFPPGALIAAYFRDSGGDAQDMSITQQQTAFLAWCTRNAYLPGHIFLDQARRGSTIVGRQGFQDLMHYFRTGHAPEAGLVIWSYSRFARDIDDSQFFRADLRRRGYQFYSLNDEIPDGPMGRLFEAAIDWKNEQFLEDLSRDVKRGLHDLVRQHGAVPGTPPIGFLRQPITIGQRRDGRPHTAHRWAPDPALIPRIQQAFTMRAAGKSLSDIHNATRLYNSLNSYPTMFTNPLYIGELHFGDFIIPDYCPPIIDLATWQTVQAIAARHAHHRNNQDPAHPQDHPRRVASPYLLSGIARCARCAAPLYGKTVKQPTGAYYNMYACTSAKRRQDCDLQPIPARPLETAILTSLQEYILTPAVQQAHQQAAQAFQSAQIAALEQQRTEARRTLAGLRRRIANITEAIAETGATRALIEKLSALETDETTLLSQLTTLEQQLTAPLPSLTPSEIAAMTDRLQRILASQDQAAIQRLLRAFIASITVDREDTTIRGTITYYYPPETPPTTGPDPPEESMPIFYSPMGALTQRHTFAHSFTTHMRKWTKKRP